MAERAQSEHLDAGWRTRVVTLERDVGHIEKQVDAIRSTMATRADIDKITTSLAELGGHVSSAGRPNWQAMAVMVTALGLIGTLLYWPINVSITDLKAQSHEVFSTTIQQQRYNADKTRNDADLTGIREDMRRRLQTDEYRAAHDALEKKIDSLIAQRNGQMQEIIRRIERIEGVHLK